MYEATRVILRTTFDVPPSEALGRVIFEFARARPNACVVQIGSHDATQLDPLRRYILTKRWRGVLVEPMPPVFERLKRTYAGVDGLIFENVAIFATDGSMDMYYLPQTDDWGLPRWYDALASFNRDVLLSHRSFIPDIDERIQTMTVPTVTFDTLLSRNGISDVDFVQIDAEGYDLEIVKSIDLNRYAPTMLQVEELHLDEAMSHECLSLLTRHGYQAIGNGMDLLALRPDLLHAHETRVRRTWDRLRGDDARALFRA